MTMGFQAFAENHVVIMSAPNGARRSQLDHPALPITPAELALNAVALRDAGVSILHLQVRDEYAKHSLDAERYPQASPPQRTPLQPGGYRVILYVQSVGTLSSCRTVLPPTPGLRSYIRPVPQ